MKIRPLIILVLIIILSAGLMISGSLNESPIIEEPSNLAAAYSCIRLIDCSLPASISPLNRLILGLPFLFNTRIPHQQAKEIIKNNPEVLAQELLYRWNQPGQLLIIHRLIPIIFTLLLIIIVYFWSKKLIGENWALLPALIIALSPNFLAYGRYITSDLLITAIIFLIIYFLVKCLYCLSVKKIFLLGLLLSIAQLLAIPTIPFFATFLIAVITFSLIHQSSPLLFETNNWLSAFIRGLIIFIIIIAIALLTTAVFNFFIEAGINYKTADSSFIKSTSNFFQDSIQTTINNVIDAFTAINAETSVYFLNKLWVQPPFYYLISLFVLKEPLAILIIILFGLIIGFHSLIISGLSKNKTSDYLKIYFPEATMGIFAFFYIAYLVFFSVPDGFRNLLPVLPFIYILAVSAIKNLPFRNKFILIAGLIIWLGIESIKAAPHQLAYFNQLAGGINNGYRVAVESNYDWGQDLKYLAEFVEKEKINKIAVDYYGGGNPIYHLKDKAILWSSDQSLPQEAGIKWLAVSATKLMRSQAKLLPNVSRQPEKEYQWLKEINRPVARAGKTIFIYKLDPL